MKAFLQEIGDVWRPHPGQRRFLLAKAPYRALACGRRWGKTDACAVAVAQRLLRGPKGTVLLVAPTLDQSRILFERLLDLMTDLHTHDPARFALPRYRPSPHPRLEIGDRRAIARSGHRPRSLRGMGADGLVVDEAAYVPPGLIGEVLFPMLATAERGTITLLSTPSGFGEFQRFFERGGSPGYWSASAPSAENPRVSRGFLDLMRGSMPEASFAREYEGRFAGLANGFFAFDAVRRAIDAGPDVSDAHPFHAGLDVARTRDWTALVVLQGTRTGVRTRLVERWRGLGWEAQLRRVAERLAAFPGATLRVDGTGMGDPVVAWARERMPDVPIRVTVFGSESKRAMMEGLAELLEKERLGLTDHRELTDELLSFVRRPSGRIEGSSEHDDLVCALALAALDLGADGGILLGREMS